MKNLKISNKSKNLKFDFLHQCFFFVNFYLILYF